MRPPSISFLNANALQTISASAGVQATGGTVTTVTIGGVTYRVHTFTSAGTFTVTRAGQVEYLIVGGGGAGGPGLVSPQRPGCGGNAGQMLTGSTTVTVQAYAITIGAGGVGASDTSGSASSALGLTATGGSIGASQNGPYAGTGASGGVNGLQSSINGSSTYYGGGGGAAQFPPGNVAGLGGGGTGATPDSLGNGGQSGTANTGGGGGGGYGRSNPPASRRSGGDGGSGIVTIRYAI